MLCGTAPSRISKQVGAYYATSGNLFWPTLHEIGLTPRRFAPTDYPELLALRIGLTDLNKSQWGSDAELSADAFDVVGLHAKITRFAPAAVAFTSKTAGRIFFGRPVAYGQQADSELPEPLCQVAWFVLSSPSGRARNHWSAEPWRELGRFVAALRRARVSASAAEPSRKSGAPRARP